MKDCAFLCRWHKSALNLYPLCYSSVFRKSVMLFLKIIANQRQLSFTEQEIRFIAARVFENMSVHLLFSEHSLADATQKGLVL